MNVLPPRFPSSTLSCMLAALPSLCRLCGRWGPGPVCPACTREVTRPTLRCGRCALPGRPAPGSRHPEACADCEVQPPGFDHALAAMDYDGPVPALFGALKFKGDAPLATWMARQLVGPAQRRWRQPDGQRWRPGAPTLLLPMPLSLERLRERGFNQTLGLARQVAAGLALPFSSTALTRPRHTNRLMRLGADERHRAIAGAFALSPQGARQVAGRHVALVDDVLTTGATAAEAARVLWQAGAREVSIWVVARTPAPSRAPDEGGQDGSRSRRSQPVTDPDAALQHDRGKPATPTRVRIESRP